MWREPGCSLKARQPFPCWAGRMLAYTPWLEAPCQSWRQKFRSRHTYQPLDPNQCKDAFSVWKSPHSEWPDWQRGQFSDSSRDRRHLALISEQLIVQFDQRFLLRASRVLRSFFVLTIEMSLFRSFWQSLWAKQWQTPYQFNDSSV